MALLETGRWETTTELEVERERLVVCRKQLQTAQRQLKEALGVREKQQMSIAELHRELALSKKAPAGGRATETAGVASGVRPLVPHLDLGTRTVHIPTAGTGQLTAQSSSRSGWSCESELGAGLGAARGGGDCARTTGDREDKWHLERVAFQREVRKAKKQLHNEEEQTEMISNQLAAKKTELSHAHAELANAQRYVHSL